MTEKNEKAATGPSKIKAPKKASSDAAAKSPVSEPQKKTGAKQGVSSGGTVTIEQIGSPIGRQGYQRATLIGLGLNKLRRTRTLEDTPSVRGMIAKVQHLVKVVE